MHFDELSDKIFSTLFRYVEKLVLLIVAGFAFGAILQTSSKILSEGAVNLSDLLLIFIYVEIMAMANIYFIQRAVPFTYPMFIAVTALSRLIVLQGKEISAVNLLFEGGAILLVSIAIFIVRYSQRYDVSVRRDSSVE